MLLVKRNVREKDHVRITRVTLKRKKTLSAYERVLYQLTVCFQLQRRRSTLKFGYACLTLKEGPKVKSDHIKRFQAHHFLYVGIPSQTSRTNNK